MAWNQNFNEFAGPQYFTTEEISSLPQQVDKLSYFIYDFAVGNAQQMQACRICSLRGHSTEMCPMLQEESYGQINDAGGFLGQPPGHWPTNHNFSDYQQFNQSYLSNQEQGQSFDSTSDMSLEDMFKSFMTNVVQFQQETHANMQRISIQMEQLKDMVSRLEVHGVKEVDTPDEITPTSSKPDVADNINTDEGNVYMDNDVLCGDNTPKVEEVVESTEKEDLEDAITDNLGLEETIQMNQDLKGATDSLISLPLISDKNSVISIPLTVPQYKLFSFVLKDFTPDMKPLPDYIKYIFLEEGVKYSYGARMGCNLPIRNIVMDGVRKIHEVGVT